MVLMEGYREGVVVLMDGYREGVVVLMDGYREGVVANNTRTCLAWLHTPPSPHHHQGEHCGDDGGHSAMALGLGVRG